MPLRLIERSRLAVGKTRWPWTTPRPDRDRNLMQPTREERLAQFDGEIFGRIEGWLGDRMSQIVRIFGTLLDAGGVRGNIVEFGVHHGLFLFLLNALRGDGEKCFAIDVFDEQHLNIDHSGSGSLAIFSSYLENFLGSQRAAFEIIQRDTLSFSTREMIEMLGGDRAKFVSIDAGHTIQHACNDLHLAQEILASGGIVALDDYMSVHWPGVTEGFYRFMNGGNRRLKPFLYFQNKLFLTTVSEHAAFLRQFRACIESEHGEEVRLGRWKDVAIAGANCLSFA